MVSDSCGTRFRINYLLERNLVLIQLVGVFGTRRNLASSELFTGLPRIDAASMAHHEITMVASEKNQLRLTNEGAREGCD